MQGNVFHCIIIKMGNKVTAALVELNIEVDDPQVVLNLFLEFWNDFFSVNEQR